MIKYWKVGELFLTLTSKNLGVGGLAGSPDIALGFFISNIITQQ